MVQYTKVTRKLYEVHKTWNTERITFIAGTCSVEKRKSQQTIKAFKMFRRIFNPHKY